MTHDSVLTEHQLPLTGEPVSDAIPASRPTQRDRVLAQLRHGPTCGTEFSEMHIPRFGGRIMELRNEGYTITNENCWKHRHFSRQTIYRLAAQMGEAT